MSNPPPDPGPVRRHLIALPRGRPGAAPARHRLVALPRGRPIVRFDEPAGAPPIPLRRDRRPLAAVVSSFCLLLLLCCGGLAAVMSRLGGDDTPPAPARTSRRPAQAGATPRTPAPATPSTGNATPHLPPAVGTATPETGTATPRLPPAAGTATPRPVRQAARNARLGHRCMPSGAIGRAHNGLLVTCGPDRRGRDRWRPMTPTALRAAAPDLH